MDNKKIRDLEIVGIIFTYSLGTFLKYSCQIFDWDVWTIIFGAVNSSAWETIKSFTMPYLVWAAIEFCLTKIPIKKFVVSKIAGLYTIISLFIIEFAFSLSIFDWTPQLINVFTCFLWILASFCISYKILVSISDINDVFVLCIFMMILFFSMYLSFTINPPHLNLFKDNILQIYGIPICLNMCGV